MDGYTSRRRSFGRVVPGVLAGAALVVGIAGCASGASGTGTMADAGVTLDLTDGVNVWGQADEYYPTSWETTQFDGSTWGIPHVADAYAVYHNEDLLAAVGAEPPLTWEEMESTAAAIAAFIFLQRYVVAGLAEGATKS